MTIPWIFKTLLCKHDYKFHDIVTGDKINHLNGKRHEYVCTKCGRLLWK